MEIYKKMLIILIGILMLGLPLASAGQYSVNVGRQIGITADYPADSSYSFIFIGAYWSATKGNDQWTPTFYDVDNSGIYLPDTWIQGGISRGSYVIETDITGGADPDTTVYDDEKAVFLMTRDTSPYTPLAWWYWETPWVGTDYSYWLVEGQDVPTVINPNSWDTVTYNFNVVDSKGNPIPYYHYDLIVDFVADDSGNYGVRSTNKGLFTHVLDEYLSGSLTGIDGVIYNTTMIKIEGTTFEEKALTLPKWVYYGDQYDTDDQPYKLRFRAVYNVKGTDYYSDWVTVDTTNGNSDITLTIPYDTQGGISQDYVYISFYYNQNYLDPVYLGNYVIDVIKAYSPDGFSSPATHTYELASYYTLKIPLDTNYPYLVVSLLNPQDNSIIFKKGYLMEAGSYAEVLEGTKYPVTFRVYDSTLQQYVEYFEITAVGKKTTVIDTGNQSVTLLLDAGVYDITIKDSNGAILYSTTYTVDSADDVTFFVKSSYLNIARMYFYTSNLKPVNVVALLNTYKLVIQSGVYYVDLTATTQFKYSTNKGDLTNNWGDYLILTKGEQDSWKNGVTLIVYDKETNTILKRYNLVLDDSKTINQFMIVLPVVNVWWVDDTGNTVPNAPTNIPTFTSGFSEQDSNMIMGDIFGFFFGDTGLIYLVISVAGAFAIGSVAGAGAGLFMGITFLLVFGSAGYLPKSIVAVTSLGMGALLLHSTGLVNIIKQHREGGD